MKHNLRRVLSLTGTVIEYIVDGRNRRIGKKVNGTLQRQWIYDGQLRPVAELNASGTLTATYIYATQINVPDYIVKGTTTYRVITDHLGSLRFVINTSNGTIAQRIDYDDWGNVLLNTAPDFTPFGFAGGIYDKDTKLVRFGARDYDAECGRWTTKDPLDFYAGQSNLYGYCSYDPINSLDYSGLDEITSNMGLLACFSHMYAQVGYGQYKDERGAWIRKTPEGGYCLEFWPITGQLEKITVPPFIINPDEIVGMVHTHQSAANPSGGITHYPADYRQSLHLISQIIQFIRMVYGRFIQTED